MEMTTGPIVDIAKFMEQFRLPGVNMSALVDSRRKDIAALSEANQIAFKGMQSLAQKQVDILRETMQEAQSAMQRMGTGATVATPGEQGEIARQAFQKALANMQALAEMAGKSQTEVFAVISKRVQQSIEESRTLG